jgi:hypothetical protein
VPRLDRQEQRAYAVALLLCDLVATDPGSNKITLYGIFDELFTSAFPAIHPVMSVFWRAWIPGPGKIGTELLKPSGEVLYGSPPLELPADRKEGWLQGGNILSGLEFPSEGSYEAVLRFNGDELLRAPFKVSHKA